MKVGVTVKGEGYVVKQKEQVSGEQRTVQLTLQTAKAAVTGIADEAPDSSDPNAKNQDNNTKTADEGKTDGDDPPGSASNQSQSDKQQGQDETSGKPATEGASLP